MQNKVIEGEVKKGQRIGTTYGFPTANIDVEEELESGIYAGKVKMPKGEFLAALYVGKKNPKMIEAHLVGYAGEDFYGESIMVVIDKKLREEKDNLTDEEIMELIENDVKNVIRHFSVRVNV